MDLPTCPACGQSVLDDNATDCPFCGASMSGKPSTKTKPATNPRQAKSSPAGNKPAAGATSATKTRPSSTEAAKKSTSTTKKTTSASDEDDPFELEHASQTTAIRAAPKRVKGRPYQIKCPMCDTVGFIPTQAAGRDVRCANPKCMVPVFKAPLIEREATTEKEPASFWSSMTGFVVMALLFFIIAGGSLWFFVIRDDDAARHGTRTGGTNKRPDSNDADETAEEKGEVAAGPESTGPIAQTLTRDEIRQRILPLMVNSALDSAGNRSKPLCRRITSETFAAIDDLEGAQLHLDALREVGMNIPYYQVTPLVAIAWRRFEAGETDAAKQLLDKAWNAAQNLPRYGRDHLDIATELAAALIIIGRASDARALINDHQKTGSVGQHSALLQMIRANRSFDYDSAQRHGPLREPSLPQSVAVTLELAGRGYWNEARTWAESISTEAGRTECLIAWAQARVNEANQNDQTDISAEMEAVAEKLSSPGRARLFAGIAATQLLQNNPESAGVNLELAIQALAEVAAPQPVLLPGLKDFFDFHLPNPATNQMAALASAEISRVQAKMGERNNAWQSLQTAMTFLRGSAPALPAIQSRLAVIATSADRSRFRNTLKSTLNLSSDNAATKMYRRYSALCRSVKKAAQTRFEFQTSLLIDATRWDLRDEIWLEMRTRSEQLSEEDKEPFYDSDLPWALADAYEFAGETDRAQEIKSLMADRNLSRGRQQEAEHKTEQLILEGDLNAAAEQFDRSSFGETWRSAQAIKWTCYLARSEKTGKWFELVSAFDEFREDILREESMALAAAMVSRKGEARKILKLIEREKLSQTERIALCHGLVMGQLAYDRDSAGQPSAPPK